MVTPYLTPTVSQSCTRTDWLHIAERADTQCRPFAMVVFTATRYLLSPLMSVDCDVSCTTFTTQRAVHSGGTNILVYLECSVGILLDHA